MGQCAGLKSSRPRAHELVPQDIDKYDANAQKLNKLHFQGYLSNIRIKNSPQNTVSLKFQLHEVLDFPLPKKSRPAAETQIKWKTHQKFNFESNQYLLRTKFLKVYVYDEKYTELDSIKVNLYCIVNGPYHHDFSIKVGSKRCRLVFDLKISEPRKVEIQLSKEYPGEQFNYSFKILKQDDTNSCLNSNPSDTQIVPLMKGNSFRRMSAQEQCPSPTKKRKAACKLIKVETTSIVNWDKQKNVEMSQFSVKMNTMTLMKASIQFVLWKRFMNQKEEQMCLFFADCYFPFSQLFADEGQTNGKTNQKQRTITFQQHLYTNGKVVGQSKFQIVVSHKSFFKQSKACARTEDGVINMASEFEVYGANTAGKNEAIEKLCAFQRNISTKNIELNNLEIGCGNKSRKIREEMVVYFQEMLKLLESTAAQVPMLTTQEHKLELLTSQDKLLQLVENLYPFIEDQDVNFSEVCWSIIVEIMKRAQLFLKYMGFSEQEAKKLENKHENAYLVKKVNVSLRYQKLINKILLLTLNFSYADYRKESKAFAQLFKAHCYIRIPIFRQKFLDAIVRNGDSEAQEWKFNDLGREEMNTNEQARQLNRNRLDWQSYFYEPLEGNPVSQKNKNQLIDSLHGHGWFKLVANRRNQFFEYVKHLMDKLQELGRKVKFNKWHYLPGYNKVVRSFIVEMKSMNIVQYPRSLEVASIAMLANEKLINIIMTVIIQKTNCFENISVSKTLDLLASYFSYLTKSKPTLPVTFHYLYFFKAIKLIIQNSFSYSTSKALVLLYNFYDKFSAQFRQNLMKYLLGKVFFKLYLHWSYSVRSIFHHLLVLKLDQQIRASSNPENVFLRMNDVSEIYKQRINIILNAEEAKKNQERQNMIRTYEKDFYKIMKRKITQKRNMRKQKEKMEQMLSPSRKRRGTVSFATPQVNKKDRYRLSELSSTKEQPSEYQYEMEMKKLQMSFTESKYSSPELGNEFSLQPRKMQSSTNSSMSCVDPQKSDRKKKSKRKFSFVAQEQFELNEIEENELPYLCIAANEFRQINVGVKKYIAEKGQLPQINLGLEVPIDEKQIRPSMADRLESSDCSRQSQRSAL